MDFDWKIEGGHRQSTTEGIPSPSPDYPSEIETVGSNGNLYDKKNPNVLDTALDNNGLGANVKDTYKTVWIPCKPNTTYTVSKKYDASKNRFALAYSSTEPNYSQQVEGYVSNMHTKVITITTNSTAKYLLAYVWTTGGSITYQEMLDSIKIERGVQATADSGYGCGNIEINTVNKNLLDQSLKLFQGNYANNGNIILNKDKRIDDYIPLSKGDYILWSTTNNWINVLIYDENKKLLSRKNSNTDKEIAFTLNKDGYIRLGFNPIVDSLDVFQLERGIKKTTKEEHKQQTVIMPIQQEMLTGDYISNVEHHEWGKTVLDGTENWVTITAQKGDNTSYFYYTKTDMKKASPIICNQFINREVWSTDVEGIQSITDNLIRLRINTSRASTVSELKALLKLKYDEGNPVVVYYKLETPINLELTEEQKAIREQKLYTYKNITNIAVSDELASIDVTYKKDLETMFNNIIKQIPSSTSDTAET